MAGLILRAITADDAVHCVHTIKATLVGRAAHTSAIVFRYHSIAYIGNSWKLTCNDGTVWIERRSSHIRNYARNIDGNGIRWRWTARRSEE